MFDDGSEELGVFDFDELANQLLEQGLEASPSTLHGCLTGVLTAGAQAEAELGLDALGQAMDVVIHGELAGRLMQLYTTTAAALVDDEFTFNLILPDDEVALDIRTQALAQWCQGFLAGFAQINASADKAGVVKSADSREILADIAAIAEAEVREQEGEAGNEQGFEQEDEESEELEHSYMELVEYLRFAVLNVYMDDGTFAGESSAEAPSLH